MSPDTITALDAVQEAVTALATAVMDAKDAFNPAAPADPTEVKVGDFAATEAAALALLERLPVGAKVEDRDGDRWTTADDGKVTFENEGRSSLQIAENAAGYAPLTVAYLPETSTTPEPEPYAPKDGDRVKILGLSIFDADYIGQLGTVVDANYGPGRVIVTPDDDARARRIYKVADLERTPEPEPEPVPTDLRLKPADNRGREIRVEPAYFRGGSAYIRVDARGTESSDIWLSPDEARRVAATLNEIAGPPSPF